MTMLHTSSSWTLAAIKTVTLPRSKLQLNSIFLNPTRVSTLASELLQAPESATPNTSCKRSQQTRKDGWPAAVARLSHRYHSPGTATEPFRTRKTAEAVPAFRAKPAATFERIPFQEQWAFPTSSTCTTGHAPLDTFTALQHHSHHLLRRHSNSSDLPCPAG